jgi:hypothetical protein
MVRTRHRETWQVRHHSHGYCNACAMRRKRHPKETPVPAPTLGEFDWQTRAACKGADPEQFFAGRGVSRETLHTALTYCAHCPVMAQCGRMADRYRWIGLWGMAWRSQNGDWRNKDGYHVEPIRVPDVGEHAQVDAAVGRHPSARKGAA